ncbi:MAG: hypothetical protein WBW32_10340 [Luteibacter sp.]
MSHGTSTTMRKMCAALVLLGSLGAAHAAVPEGRWKGVMEAGGDATRVTATHRAEMLLLSFGEPGNCRLPAELLKEVDGWAQFRFNPSANGGKFCAALYPGGVEVMLAGAALHVSFVRAGRTWSGVLEPVALP